MDHHIRHAELTLEHIPLETADWDEIYVFAHTFDGYSESGSFARCAAIAHQRQNDTLTALRTCLFFEARSWRHGGGEPGEDAMVYLRGLIRKIRYKVSCAEIA